MLIYMVIQSVELLVDFVSVIQNKTSHKFRFECFRPSAEKLEEPSLIDQIRLKFHGQHFVKDTLRCPLHLAWQMTKQRYLVRVLSHGSSLGLDVANSAIFGYDTFLSPARLRVKFT